VLNIWQRASSARCLSKKARGLTTPRSSKPPSPDSLDAIESETRLEEYDMSENSQEPVSQSTAPPPAAAAPRRSRSPRRCASRRRRRWRSSPARHAEEGDGCRVFVRLVFNPTLALENAEDVALGRDEELADLLLTGDCLRKCVDVAL
jgi:hypothetical protein